MPHKLTRQPFFSQEHHSWAIPLTRDVIALIDTDNVEVLGAHNWYAENSENRRWYAARDPRGARRIGNMLYMHTAVLGAKDGFIVDHIRHYPFESRLIDNRRANLRHSTVAQNSRNSRRALSTTSPYRGVSWHTRLGKYRAVITVDGHWRQIGYYRSAIEAAHAYDETAIRLHGEFAMTNKLLGLID